jgi:MarR family transcriptional regulator, organic hydroperoxide resistance regulator
LRDGHAAFIGLAGTQYTVLIAIRHLEVDADVSPRQIAEHLRVSSAFVAMETGKLERAGLIDKTRDRNDQRRLVLRTTERARELLARLAPTQRQLNDLEFGSLGRADFRNLLRIVNQLVQNCDAALALQRHLQPAGSTLEDATT